MRYPELYPTIEGRRGQEIAWDFLILNELRSTYMTVLWFSNELERLETLYMARKAKQTGRIGESTKAEWTGFANVTLSATDKEVIASGAFDGEAVLDILSEVIGTGHKMTIGYDKERDTVTVAITGHYAFCKNAGLTMTSFAGSLSDALTVAAYKMEVVTKGDWSKFVSAPREKELFG